MLTSILMAWLTASAGIWLASRFVRGVHITSDGDALWAGALLGLLQFLLTWPIFVLLGLGTLGIGFLLWFITRWIASALVIQLAAKLSSRLEVRSFWAALSTAFLVALSGTVLRWLF